MRQPVTRGLASGLRLARLVVTRGLRGAQGPDGTFGPSGARGHGTRGAEEHGHLDPRSSVCLRGRRVAHDGTADAPRRGVTHRHTHRYHRR